MSLPRRRFTNAAKAPSGLAMGDRRDFPSHRKWVRGFPCVVCDAYEFGELRGMGRIECAHVRIATDGGTALKPHDAFTLPLCSEHHSIQHRVGERSFEKDWYPRAFPKGLKARALEFALKSPVPEVVARAKQSKEDR